jgi:hypothetical protein
VYNLVHGNDIPFSVFWHLVTQHQVIVLLIIEMAQNDLRISNKELAAINAAAVTKEYRVQPHLGKSLPWKLV